MKYTKPTVIEAGSAASLILGGSGIFIEQDTSQQAEPDYGNRTPCEGPGPGAYQLFGSSECAD